jgi:hypothetical protein
VVAEYAVRDSAQITVRTASDSGGDPYHRAVFVPATEAIGGEVVFAEGHDRARVGAAADRLRALVFTDGASDGLQGGQRVHR